MWTPSLDKENKVIDYNKSITIKTMFEKAIKPKMSSTPMFWRELSKLQCVFEVCDQIEYIWLTAKLVGLDPRVHAIIRSIREGIKSLKEAKKADKDYYTITKCENELRDDFKRILRAIDRN